MLKLNKNESMSFTKKNFLLWIFLYLFHITTLKAILNHIIDIGTNHRKANSYTIYEFSLSLSFVVCSKLEMYNDHREVTNI